MSFAISLRQRLLPCLNCTTYAKVRFVTPRVSALGRVLTDASPRSPPQSSRCESDGQVILIDLRQNRYLGVGGRHVARLAGVVDGWPAPTLVEGSLIFATDADELARPLLAKGILTTQPFEPAPRPVLEEATTSLNALDLVPRPSVGVRRVHRFMYGAIAAALRLRHQSLFTVAMALRGRRERCEPTACPRSPGQLRDAVAAYETLRPFAFTARDRCLYDLLALVNFLAGEGRGTSAGSVVAWPVESTGAVW